MSVWICVKVVLVVLCVLMFPDLSEGKVVVSVQGELFI